MEEPINLDRVDLATPRGGPADAGETKPLFDVEKVRRDFPLLKTQMNGKPLVYLDSAASAQKPSCVLEALNVFYTGCYSNIHRGVYDLSASATEAYEDSRKKARQLINAKSEKEIVFVRGTTEAINLVAYSYGGREVGRGDEVLITQMEHHSNIVPWQLLCESQGAKLRVAPINDRGELIMDEFEKLISPKTKIVAVTHQSNSLGTVNPVKEIVELAHRHGVPVLLDGAQAIPHKKVDVQDLGCDFYAFSAHKMYGPTGIGILYGREELLEKMPPWQGGGDMILSVTFDKTTYAELPHKFEAGTPDIAGGVAFGTTVDYLLGLDLDAVASYESMLLDFALNTLAEIPEIRFIGSARDRSSVISFELEGVHPHDVGTILDKEGVAIRTGHHCTQPVMDRFGVPATARASIACYNTKEDILRLADGLKKTLEVFR